MKGTVAMTLCQYTPLGAGTRIIGPITIANNEQKKKRVITTEDHKTQVVRAETRSRNIESSIAIDIDEDIQKGKRVINDDTQIGLHVKIIEAIGIDNPSLHKLVRSRHYNVVCWVEHGGEEFRTTMIEGLTLSWNEIGMIVLESPDDHVFLNVEVQRFNSKVDPGTSNGRVVVGRARIPFPKELYREVKGCFQLVRAEGEEHKPEGEIIMAMRLERVSYNSPVSSH